MAKRMAPTVLSTEIPVVETKMLLVKDFTDISHRIALPIDRNNKEVKVTEYYSKSDLSVCMFRLPYKRQWRNGQIVLSVRENTDFIPSFTLVQSPYRMPLSRTFDHLIIIEGSGILTTYKSVQGIQTLQTTEVVPGNVIVADAWYEYTLECNRYKGTQSLVFLAITGYDFRSVYTNNQNEPLRSNGAVVMKNLKDLAVPTMYTKMVFEPSLSGYDALLRLEIPPGGRTMKPYAYIHGMPNYIGNGVFIVVSGKVDIEPREKGVNIEMVHTIATENDIISMDLSVYSYIVKNAGTEKAYVICLVPTGLRQQYMVF